MLYIIFLCLVQGIGECLPISSSAHLHMLSHFFRFPETSTEIEATLHIGSLLGICIYFHKPLCNIFCGTFQTIFKRNVTDGFATGLIIFLATLPAIAFGFFLKKYLVLPHTIFSIGIAAIVFGFLLFYTDTSCSQENDKVNFPNALCIGFAQMLAFIPGASRLGVCLTMGRYLNINRWAATQFSFMLSIPVILGAATLSIIDLSKTHQLHQITSVLPTILPIAAITIGTLMFMRSFLARHSYAAFGLYRVVVGIFLVMFALMHR